LTDIWGMNDIMRDLDDLFDRLEQSSFRRKFRLGKAEREYLASKGMEAILTHGADFIQKRLAPAFPVNDGRQTPMRKHPVFVAQHATATCCRGCVEKWHAIPKGRELSAEESAYLLEVIGHWLRKETGD
jgi:hypothetical protein